MSFFDRVRSGEIDVYNEFSLQHELGVHLRTCAWGLGLRIQFERPVSYFVPASPRLIKKEIDIAAFTPDKRELAAIELKFPKNGQYPEQMFKACQDIGFLEQLMSSGFAEAHFVMAVDDRLFRAGDDLGGVYSAFRSGKTLCGTIRKPTGQRDEQVDLRGSYSIGWKAAGPVHFALVQVA